MRDAVTEVEIASVITAPINVAKLRQNLSDSAPLLRELAQLFLDDAPKQIQQIWEAISRSDARALEMSAHSLKGAAFIFCAAPLAEAARGLENLGRAGKFLSVREAFEILEKEWTRVKPELEQLCIAVQTQ